MRAAYTYNGLHQRASRRAAANLQYILDAPPRPDTDDEPGWNSLGNLYYYDSAWRLCEERAATHWDGAAAFTAARITQRFWCPLYIDALIATQADTDDAGLTGAPAGTSPTLLQPTLFTPCATARVMWS